MRRTTSEQLSGDERKLLGNCYSTCQCPGCTIRRETIAKALRIIDSYDVCVGATEVSQNGKG